MWKQYLISFCGWCSFSSHCAFVSGVVRGRSLLRSTEVLHTNGDPTKNASTSSAVPPFLYYVYDTADFNWRRDGCVWGPEKRSLALDVESGKSPRPSLFYTLQEKFMGKHMSDILFSDRALEKNHPWRTEDPEKAQVFVVPALLNLLSQAQSSFAKDLGPICCPSGEDKLVCDSDLAANLDAALGKSEYFRRKHGADHVIVASHWQSHLLFEHTLPNVNRLNVISFEGELWWKSPGVFAAGEKPRKRIPDLYVPVVCPSETESTATPAAENENQFLKKKITRNAKEQDVPVRARSSSSSMQALHSTRHDEQSFPPAGYFSMIGQVDKRPAYQFRKCICEAVDAIADAEVRDHSICASTSNATSTVFPNRCPGEPDVWPSRRTLDSSTTPPEKNNKLSATTSEIACTMGRSTKKYCDALTKTRFTLYASGDTPSSNRLADAIEYGSVPVFLQKNQTTLLPFRSRIPWDKLAVVFPTLEEDEESCDREHLAAVLARVAHTVRGPLLAAYEKKIEEYRPYLSWTAPKSKVFEMLLMEVVGPGKSEKVDDHNEIFTW
ncbi:unnamed protein product [Amoebophrya sp. A120]|nr:unnamed protein product [Amoebophrya sp. A120]|eukprot:GSA120T00003248001.1